MKITENKMKKTYLLIIAFLILWFIVIYFIIQQYKETKKMYLNSNMEFLESQINATLKTYEEFSNYIFHTKINRPEILSLVSKALNSTTEEQQHLRQQLYQLVEEDYRIIKDYNFRQLHFHFPNGDSFLRVHTPDRFGDNLFSIRESVRIANTEKRYVYGFEEGRIYNGYRFVYPLFYQEEHIGSVEVSISLSTLVNILYDLYPQMDYYFALKKSVVYDSVFTEELGNYFESIFSSQYLFDMEVYQYSLRAQSPLTLQEKEALLSQISKGLDGYLEGEESFSLVEVYKNKYFIINFLAIKNIPNEPVGYFISISKDNQFQMINGSLYRDLTLISLLFFTFFIYIADRTKKENQIKKQYIELNDTYNQLTKSKELLTKNYEEIKQLKEEAEAANKAKSQFLANMSHELRTPLTAIHGMIYLTKLTDLNEEQREYINILTSAAEHLLEIINNILDLSKIEDGKIRLGYYSFNLKESIEEALKPYIHQCSMKGIHFSFQWMVKNNGYYIGDRIKINQIIINLVSNAIKFTDEGEILIRVSEPEASQKGATLLFEISDTGIGITQEVERKLFQRFSQGDDTYTKKYSGTGLGLSICKSLVHMMDGEIWFKRNKEKGSVFSFTLQLDKYTGKVFDSNDKAKGHLKEKSLESSRVLVVEDNHVNNLLIRKLLDKLGVKDVVSAYDGTEALQVLEKDQDFQLILMDVQMPNLNGMEVTRRIRGMNLDIFKDIPIIAMTAYTSEEDLKKCIETGMNDYITKPIDYQRLKDVLFKVITK